MRWERVEPSRTRPEVSHSVLGAIGRQCCQTREAFVKFLRQEDCWVVQPTKRRCERRVAVSRVQDSRSMRPRFGNTNLLISHVLDSCVKLLAVLHISSAQCQSVDLWSEWRWDAADRKNVCYVICIFIYTHTKTLCCILMCCTLIYTHTFFCVHPVVLTPTAPLFLWIDI